MTIHWHGFHSALAPHIEQYLRTKRALGCKFDNEERQLRLLDRFLDEQGVDCIEAIGPECLQDFLASRRRTHARSYNNLLGYVRRLFDWIVSQQILPVSPLQAKPQPETARRIPYLFSVETITRLLILSKAFPANSPAPLRGATYQLIFALCAGVGTRVRSVSRLPWGDVEL